MLYIIHYYCKKNNMKQVSGIFILFFLLVRPLLPSSIELTPSSQISILTCSPGTELYSVFGHTAIRVTDPQRKLDIVFNYGTFDFETPHFYRKFVKGRLNYMLSVSSYQAFEQVYIEEDRSIFEQKLNLTLAQKEELLDRLLVNYKPENRFYRYDFFFDNCATRVRDIIVQSLHDSLAFDTGSYHEQLSFRQLIDPYIRHMKWIDFGIDILLGTLASRIATPVEYMFLPDFILDLFNHAYLPLDNGERQFITSGVATLYEAPPVVEGHLGSPGPAEILWGLLAVFAILTVIDIWRRKYTVWFDMVLFSLIGLFGWFLTLLWFGTDHLALNRNMNLLWAIPPFFPAGILLLRKKQAAVVTWFFNLASVILLGFLIAWPFIKEGFSPYLLPLVLTLFLRSSLYTFLGNKIIVNRSEQSTG